jgi:hypothetical protein
VDKQKRIGATSSVELCKGRLRRDGTIVELTTDKSSVWVAVKIGPERGKLKNLYC